MVEKAAKESNPNAHWLLVHSEKSQTSGDLSQSHHLHQSRSQTWGSSESCWSDGKIRLAESPQILPWWSHDLCPNAWSSRTPRTCLATCTWDSWCRPHHMVYKPVTGGSPCLLRHRFRNSSMCRAHRRSKVELLWSRSVVSSTLWCRHSEPLRRKFAVFEAACRPVQAGSRISIVQPFPRWLTSEEDPKLALGGWMMIPKIKRSEYVRNLKKPKPKKRRQRSNQRKAQTVQQTHEKSNMTKAPPQRSRGCWKVRRHPSEG